MLPKRLRGRNVTFVDLELREKGSNLLLSDLVSDMRSGARVLFVGRPGVGKTTITRHLSRRLIHKEHVYLVVRLCLMESSKIDSLGALLQAIADESFLDESFDYTDINIISNYIENTRGHGMCFLLDGYDEYVKTTRRSRLSYKFDKRQNTE